jgi:hypothetical protein
MFSFSTHEFDPSPYNPLFEVQCQGLPFDGLLRNDVLASSKNMINSHSCYYRFKSEFPAFMTFKTILNRSPGKEASFYAPNLNGFHSDNFCAEALINSELYI